jgi:hypothetical protein
VTRNERRGPGEAKPARPPSTPTRNEPDAGYGFDEEPF